MCGRKIQAGERWTLEHIVALINGGRNAEVNLGCTCSMCLPIKNAADVAEKSNVADIRKKHLGLKKSRHPMPCGRNSAFKKRMDGTVVPR